MVSGRTPALPFLFILVVFSAFHFVPECYGLKENMVFIKGGTFIMGTNDSPYPFDREGPTRSVYVEPFRMDTYEVTNAEFEKFVKQTTHITEAEKFGWSFVVENFLSDEENEKATQAVQEAPWWIKVNGAYWNQPEGPDSNIETRENHPVVHVSWNDAVKFCEWRGARLPTEAEWEFAARGGLEQKRFPWGDSRLGEGRKHMCNVFQGDFPTSDKGLDGFVGSAPVGSFPPNDFGLYDMSGNAWEWTSDWFSDSWDYQIHSSPPTGEEKICKGGSFMCHRNYCYRWRCAARTKNSPDSSSYNIGFRCAKSVSTNDPEIFTQDILE